MPEEKEREMVCERCRKATAISEMRYLPKGKEEKIALCGKCREELKVQEKKAVSSKKEAGAEDCFCLRCRYRFRFQGKRDTALSCPYCGKGDKIADYGKLQSNKLFYDKIL